MPTADVSDTTVAPSSVSAADAELEAGLALVQAAKDSGHWKPLADWLLGNPRHVAALADFLSGEQRVQDAVADRRLRPERVGTSVGEFELKDRLGEGTFGVVYRALDTKLKQERAVKLLRNGDVFSAVEAARFRYEAEVVASLDHPNVVRVLAFGESELGPYLVMKLMTGGSLADRLRKLGANRQLDPKEAAKIVRAVAGGVHHAHQRGLIHRDLKPGNILLDDAGTPHVADFGLARRVDATVSTAAGIAGTAAYMAPEQARGEKGLTTAVDVHALGAILFELLAGQLPFGGGDIASVLRRVADEPPPLMKHFRTDVPRDLESICRKCLEKRPADRYASAQELADDLTNFIEGRPVMARPRGLLGELGAAISHPAEVQSFVTLPLVAFATLHHPAVHLVIMALVLAGAAPAWTFGVMVYHLVAWIGQVWLFSMRRHRELNGPERRSNMTHLAMWLGAVTLLPVHLTLFGTDVMPLYPVLNALSATGIFIAGGLYAGRMYVLALLMLSQNLFLPFLPFWAWPLLHGVVNGAIFALFGAYVWRVHAAARRCPDAPVSPPHRANP